MQQIEQTYTLKAAPAEVFRALTDARTLETWFTTSAESAARPGGRFRYTWDFPDAPEKDHVQQGEYGKVEAPKRLTYPWAVGEARTRVAFQLEAADGGTRLRLSHTGWTDAMEDARQAHDEGWRMFLGNLKSVLEDGVDRRAELAGMKVGA